MYIPSRVAMTLGLAGGTLLTEILNDLSDFPSRYQLAVKIGCRVALSLLAWNNLYRNPDSTHAREPYQPHDNQ